MMGADQGQDAAVVPQVMYGPDAEHALETRRFQGIPSLAVTPEGRTWVTWYAGKTPAEDQNNYVVIAWSDKAGGEWTEHVIIDPDGEGPLRAFDPQLWMDPTGRLWSIWSQTVEHKGLLSGVWAMTNDQPERTDSRWSAPRRLTAYVSGDDGRNWSEGLMLDEREEVSYPDGQQGPDAAISIVYDRSRRGEREILLCRFTEEDVLADGSGAGVKPEIVSRPSAKV